MELIESLTKVEDKVIDALTSVQEPVVGGVRKVVGVIDDRMPDLPSLPLVDRLPKRLPIVDNGVGFAKRLVDVNSQFARELVGAVKPLLPTQSTPARKPAAKKAPAKAAA